MDSNGDEITLYKSAKRTVVLNSDCAEVIRLLGATDEVVGDPMCVMAGGRNITGDLIGAYPKVDPEWVIAQNPNVVVRAASASYDNTSEPEAIPGDTDHGRTFAYPPR